MAFLENAKILLDNNEYIDIKNLFRTMKVIGAKGEINTVLGRARRLLNHKPRSFIRINDKLTITTERVLVGPQGLYVGNMTHFHLCNAPRDHIRVNPETQEDELWLMEDFIEVYLPDLSVEEGRGSTIFNHNERWLEKSHITQELAQDLKAVHGLDAEKELANSIETVAVTAVSRALKAEDIILINHIELGTVLYGEDQELITVNKIEDVSVDGTEIIFIPITNGSTSYIVDGFAVCGWLRNDCFNYETWNKIKEIDYDHVALAYDASNSVIIISKSMETERYY